MRIRVSPGLFVFPYRYNATPIVIELSPFGINRTLPTKKNSISLSGKTTQRLVLYTNIYLRIIIGFGDMKKFFFFYFRIRNKLQHRSNM